ncbi:MAG: radical SAM family heme chaperone HemW [Candidatus Omnitrophota bacterium]|nr:radical SAM family heme chaperone HemW [Candidatus Omnitrophota bacterium]
MHIPFCRSKCRYCGFYSAPYEGVLSFAYCDALALQIDSLEGEFRTIYIGGGTPTVLDLGQLRKILFSLRKFSGISFEFTIEANPESLTAEKLSLFLDEGVNRISIGVQSFDNSKLKKLGRLHDDSGAVEAVAKAEKSGFRNIGIDLIFGVWDESIPSWKKDLKIAAGLPVTHISCYGLTYEPHTSIKECLKDGSITPLPEERSADMYDLAISYLADKGFAQYEISNFSKPGFQCRHNHTYWNNDPYTGLGPSAVSYSGSVRIENIRDVPEYVEKVRSGESLFGSSEKLSPEERAKETAAVKIRTMEGIDFDWFRKKTLFELPDLEREALPKLIADGLIEQSSPCSAAEGVRLTRKGVLFCDTVSGAFL